MIDRNNRAAMSVHVKQKGISGLDHTVTAIITLDWGGKPPPDTCHKCIIAAVKADPFNAGDRDT